MLVRVGRQVQEVPRPLTRAVARGRSCARLLVLATVAGIAVAGYATFRIWEQGDRDEQRPADAIVVMGAAQYDGRPSPVFAARLDHAVELYHAGVAPRLVVTGGKADGDRTTEAAIARAYAIARGVPADGDPGRGPQPDDARVDPRRRPRCCASADLATRGLRVATRPTCCASCAWPATRASTASGSPTRTSPIDRDPVARVDAIVHELGGARRVPTCVTVRRVALTGRRPAARAFSTDAHFPSWRWGLGPVYCAKTCRSRTARAPTTGRSPAQPPVPSAVQRGSP